MANTDGKDSLLEEALIGMPPAINLTTRENEVLLLLLNGYTNKEIAKRLYRTERTIEYHRNSLMHKFGARNIVELIKRALELNYC